MNKREYFRRKLQQWRDDVLHDIATSVQSSRERSVNAPDMIDRAMSEADRVATLRSQERQRKLISKIDAALRRIDDGTYGFCEETGEPISFNRLDARPIATLSVEAQARHERRERLFRETN